MQALCLLLSLLLCSSSVSAFSVPRMFGSFVRRISRKRGTLLALRQGMVYHGSSNLRTPIALHAAEGDDSTGLSKRRAPFRMPRNSPDDGANVDSKSWQSLGLWPSAVELLTNELDMKSPTPVQIEAVPALLRPPLDHTCFLAATGSGKTLAYTLPLLQLLKQNDQLDRTPKRPRLVILAPTRELVVQIASVVKQVCHALKLSSTALTGGSKSYGQQKKSLDRPIDIVVSTPSRLLQHWKDQNVFLGMVEHVVLDETDTLLEQGFSNELRSLLYPMLYRKQSHQKDIDPEKDMHETSPRLVLTSATLTKAVLKMIGSADKDVTAKKMHRNKESEEKNVGLFLPEMKVIKAAGLHKTVPLLRQYFVDVGGADKLGLLVDSVLTHPKGQTIMIFANTAASCRAVQHALEQASVTSTAYHGELNSAVRSQNLQGFRTGETAVLVCTDLAARGLDMNVDHVVLFDFPLNALDYLHRTGRTARQGKSGKVTAFVTKRDQVLARAIERAVQNGDPVDGLSSKKDDYKPRNALNTRNQKGRRKRPVKLKVRDKKVSTRSRRGRR